MKDFKRVLSLGLAGTMLAGMMTVGASAANKDFTDADEIINTEAVNVMSTLGVLKGKDTGAFDPKATVTRAEMAKIITVMLNGGNDPTLGSTSTVMFSDIQNHWAKSYIQYCANLGIIAGQGDGTFAPDAPVTGAAAAKMLLVALGYDADIAGYQGADWDLNVNRDANEAKLYEEIKSIDTSAGLSRDNTAQMAYNALDAKIMERTDHKVVGTGEVSYTYEQSKTTSFLNKYFDAYTFIGSFEGNYYTCEDVGTKGQIKVNGRRDTEAATSVDGDGNPVSANRDAYIPSDLDISNIGEEVKVIFKDGKGGRTGTPDKNDTIYGVFNTGRTEVVHSTMGAVKNNYSDKAQVNIDGVKYNTKDSVKVYTNYVIADDAEGVSAKNGDADTEKNSSLTTAIKATNGNPIKAVMDPDDGKISAIYVTNTTLAKVTSKNSTKVAIEGVGTLTVADHEIYDGIAVDDVVTVTVLYKEKATADDALVIVEKAETVTGDVDGFKNNKDGDKNESVTLDGTTYKLNSTYTPAMLEVTDDGTSIDMFDGSDIGETVELYLVNGYVAAAVTVSESASNYSVITAIKGDSTAGGTFDSLQLQVMDAEGTKTIVTVSDDSKAFGATEKGVDDDDYLVGDIVTYTMKSGEAVVKIVAKNGTTGASTGYKKSTKTFNGVSTTSNCVLFVSTAEGEDADSNKIPTKIKAYNIRDLKDIELTTNYAVYEKDNKVVAVYLDKRGPVSANSANAVYGIISSVNGVRKVDGDTYKMVTASAGGENYTLYVDEDDTTLNAGDVVVFEPASDNIYTVGSDETSGDVVKFTKDTTVLGGGEDVVIGRVNSYNKADAVIEIYTGVEAVTNDDGEVVSYKGTGSTPYAVTGDVKMFYVDADNDTSVETGSAARFNTVDGYTNIILMLNTDEEVVAMVVEVSAEDHIVDLEDLEASEEHTHTWTHVAAKVATCKEAGNKEYYECKVAGCDKAGKYFSDEGTTEITDGVTIAKLTTHTKGDTPAYTKGTGDAEGKTHTYKCTVCEQQIEEACTGNTGDTCPCGATVVGG